MSQCVWRRYLGFGELGEKVSPDANSAGELAKPWAFWTLTAVLFALAQAASAEYSLVLTCASVPSKP